MAGSDFAHRHIGPTDSDTEHMLRHIGVGSVAELLEQTVPESIHIREALSLPAPVLQELAADIGSDVPFCLDGGTQLCFGRGEVLEPVQAPAALDRGTTRR